MEQVEKIDTVRQYNDHVGVDTLHPLVSVVKFDDLGAIGNFRKYMGIYAVFLKDNHCGNILYGGQPYDYEDGTLVFVAPAQVYGIDNHTVNENPRGYALLFHPDLLLGTALAKKMKEYSFFSYEVNEALHLSKKERKIMGDLLDKMRSEIEQNIDHHSKTLILSYIELFLNYCVRFYDRQFITRSHINKVILIKFENLLNEYFQSDKCQTLGVPTVSWCADQLNLSPNYFGDLIKKETGNTALDYIQTRVIDEAKTMIFDNEKTLSEIAFHLGFKYHQHFTRFFKNKVGVTPNEYRNLN